MRLRGIFGNGKPNLKHDLKNPGGELHVATRKTLVFKFKFYAKSQYCVDGANNLASNDATRNDLFSTIMGKTAKSTKGGAPKR